MELKSMALSAKESKAMTEPASPSANDGPRYPWGLQLRLDNESIEKLGLAGLPDTGATLMVHARAIVTETSERDSQDGGKRRTLEIQITDLAIEAEPNEGERAKTLYGGA